MKKILLIMPLSTTNWGSVNAGGVDSVCQTLLREIANDNNKNFQIHVIAFSSQPIYETKTIEISLSDNIQVLFAPTKKKYWAIKNWINISDINH